MLTEPGYDRFWNDSVTSLEDGVHSIDMSSKVAATPVTSTSPSPAHSIPQLDDPHLQDDQEVATTFCMLIPKMPQWKFANPSGFLSRSPSSVRQELPAARATTLAEAAGPASSLAAVLSACEPVCSTPCSLQVMNRFRGGGGGGGGGGAGGGGGRKTSRVEGIKLAGEEWNRKGSFINKPAQGWLHPDDRILGPGVSYIVRYMGCIEVLRSMRSLDFNTRTQVTREAINRLYEAVPGVKGTWKKKAPNKALFHILGKSNLRFAGMNIAVNISIDGLNLMVPTSRQGINRVLLEYMKKESDVIGIVREIIANHHMQSISFASGGDTDTTDYVAYVAKDPINQRACHILECCDGLAQSVINTVGQAFELRFKQYLHSPPKVVVPPDRMLANDESAWGDEEESGEHDYYNSIPGKEPPLGGIMDSRIRQGGLMGHVHTQPPSTNHFIQGGSPSRRDQNIHIGPHWENENLGTVAQSSDGYLQPDGRPIGSRDYDVHMYVNTQNLDGWDAENTGQHGPEDSPKKDLFDMRPFEDALKLHESIVVGSPPVGDQWPSPPTRKAPVAPTEEQLRREPWYHGKMSRREAEKLLQMDGDFLVRDSITNPGQYVLTGMHIGQPKHLLLVDPEGVVRTKDVLFDSISHLINYHLQNEQPIVAAESELHLRQVVKRRT